MNLNHNITRAMQVTSEDDLLDFIFAPPGSGSTVYSPTPPKDISDTQSKSPTQTSQKNTTSSIPSGQSSVSQRSSPTTTSTKAQNSAPTLVTTSTNTSSKPSSDPTPQNAAQEYLIKEAKLLGTTVEVLVQIKRAEYEAISHGKTVLSINISILIGWLS